MGRPKVLLLGDIDHPAARRDWQKFSEQVEMVESKATKREEFLRECDAGALDGIVAIYRTFDSVEVTGLVDKELVGHLPKSLKFLCHNGAGYDQIDVAACTERKIHVSNTPTAVDNATADTAVFLILGALRGYSYSIKTLRDGQWRGNPPMSLGHDPQKKILGILGMGGIGRNLAAKMRAFDMQVIYHNRTRLSEKEEDGARYVSFEDVLKQSDVLSVHVPLNAKTRHIIGKSELAMMKKGAILVNTARGAVIDEEALADALDAGHLGSVGLDVYENEPKIHPRLMSNQCALLLPHMGTWTEETQEYMEQWCINNVRMAVHEGKLHSRVPEQKDISYD